MRASKSGGIPKRFEPGTAFPDEIRNAVLSCRKMVVLCSSAGVEKDSNWMHYERSLLLSQRSLEP